MSQVLWKVTLAAGAPLATPHICGFIRIVAITSIEIEQQMGFSSDLVVPIRSWPLNILLDDRIATTWSGPCSKQPGCGNLGEHGLGRFIFHEPRICIIAQRQDVQVDDVGGTFVDVVLWL
jgi:hypothetical protein